MVEDSVSDSAATFNTGVLYIVLYYTKLLSCIIQKYVLDMKKVLKAEGRIIYLGRSKSPGMLRYQPPDSH